MRSIVHTFFTVCSQQMYSLFPCFSSLFPRAVTPPMYVLTPTLPPFLQSPLKHSPIRLPILIFPPPFPLHSFFDPFLSPSPSLASSFPRHFLPSPLPSPAFPPPLSLSFFPAHSLPPPPSLSLPFPPSLLPSFPTPSLVPYFPPPFAFALPFSSLISPPSRHASSLPISHSLQLSPASFPIPHSNPPLNLPLGSASPPLPTPSPPHPTSTEAESIGHFLFLSK
jgi:hypothetical protein